MEQLNYFSFGFLVTIILHSVMSTSINSTDTMSTIPKTTDFFNLKNNLAHLRWEHAVNDEEKLKNLGKDVQMIEADINVINGEVVMSHDANSTSSFTLDNFLNQTVNITEAKRGIKLDFKSTEAVAKGADILAKYQENIKVPLWINADILPGPGGKEVNVEANVLITQANRFNNALISIGWTTVDECDGQKYTTDMIRQMHDLIKPNSSITYPVRACIAANSTEEMKALVKDGSTLTVWTGKNDTVDITTLRKLIVDDIGVGKVYVDLPDDMKQKLNLPNSTSQFVSSFTLLMSTLIVFMFRMH